MNKLIVLLAVLSISTQVFGQGGPPQQPQPQKGSVAQIIGDCLQINYTPNDQDHQQFIDQAVVKFCGNPPPNGQVEPFDDQLNFIERTALCVENLNGPASIKGQFQSVLDCAHDQVEKNQASAPVGLAQKKVTKKSSVSKKLKKQ